MELVIDSWDVIKTMSLKELKDKYKQYLKDNIIGKDITKLAYFMEKSQNTIETYLKGEGNDVWTMRLIVDFGLQIINENKDAA